MPPIIDWIYLFKSFGALILNSLERRAAVNDPGITPIVIADEKAMSQKNSPFQSVQSMADYLSKELQNI